VNRTVVHPREVFFPAKFHSAVAIIVCHNHPSGRVDPSSEDREITTKLKNASDILGIALLDHIIVGRSCYFSFIEHGLLELPAAD
jgi:DNA repair protein RadC